MDTPGSISEKIYACDANVLIINPNLLGYTDRSLPQQLKKDHPQLSVIALVTSYTDPAILKAYDGVIEINDTKLKVVNKLNQLMQDNDKQDKADDVELSKREIDVLVAVAKGMMNKEIADQMNISIHTVISHRKNITRKTGIKSVSGLTVYALLNNLIDENEVYK
jgi:DNA-binding NarL/FixJ family response regulator